MCITIEITTSTKNRIGAVHQLMIGVDCDSAFQIGLLKSRNLDGEELKEAEIEEGFDGDDSQQGPVLIGEDGDGDMELAEIHFLNDEQSDVNMDLEDDSSVFWMFFLKDVPRCIVSMCVLMIFYCFAVITLLCISHMKRLQYL